jgi:hypothetical protein
MHACIIYVFGVEIPTSAQQWRLSYLFIFFLLHSINLSMQQKKCSGGRGQSVQPPNSQKSKFTDTAGHCSVHQQLLMLALLMSDAGDPERRVAACC